MASLVCASPVLTKVYSFWVDKLSCLNVGPLVDESDHIAEGCTITCPMRGPFNFGNVHDWLYPDTMLPKLSSLHVRSGIDLKVHGEGDQSRLLILGTHRIMCERSFSKSKCLD